MVFFPEPTHGDFIIKDFRFSTGEVLPTLNLHFRTLGTPVRNQRDNMVSNAVLIMHGTGGTGGAFFVPEFSAELFQPGQPLDISRYFIILRDAIGHGQSSKPSNGLRARFPKYAYHDIVTADHRLITEGLGVDHLRLVMGTSMGGMQTWMWGALFPTFMDALMPMASLPVEIGGMNRMRRKMMMDSITNDPEWKGGDYDEQPSGLLGAIRVQLTMTSSPLKLQQVAPTREAADELLDKLITNSLVGLDSNDLIYQFNSSREYNPAPHLHNIVAPLVAINSEDDQVNPPELGVMAANIGRVRRGRYVLIPTGPQTRGHSTFYVAALWKEELERLLAESA